MGFDFIDDEKRGKGRIIDMNDISQRVKTREKEKFKDELSGDIDDVFGSVIKKLDVRFDKMKEEKEKREKTPKNKIINFFKLIGLLGLGILVLNFILFNVWLLKYFIRSIFIP